VSEPTPNSTPARPRGLPVERVRGEHPTDGSWRADAFAPSRHTSWADELRAPLDDHDPERAAALCGEVTRNALRDFAPALILLSTEERRRVQALAAYGLVLFDFAQQNGMEGERLSQINRLEFDLESTLDGEPPGQPVFVMMGAAERAAPWPRERLDEIAGAARLRAARPRPATDAEALEDAQRLGGAVLGALTDGSSSASPGAAAGLVRVFELLALGESVRRHRARLSEASLPDDWIQGTPKGEELDEAVRSACREARELLSSPLPTPLSPTQRRAARYLQLAGRRLLDECERLASDLMDGPPKLGAWARVAFLARARAGL
jgi:hypothetical protein